MRLLSLELHGFKSFADPQKLVFPGGMTAVVGPNGCGKSNISDALAWVLGEQRASLLRGTEMADVVFAGTSERKAMNMAEVKLTIEMPDVMRPEAMLEMTISRRLFRESGSEYRINGKECRLRDVQDLLMDTGMGTRAYSFIQQGQIDLILSTKPKDRRQLLEEAAGIMRYKVRRQEAERRLDEVRTNLQRLDDILFEKGKTQDSLKRQAAKTRRALELDKAINATKRILLYGEVVAHEEARDAVSQDLHNSEAQITLLTAQAAESASEVERQRLALDKLHEQKKQQTEQMAGIANRLSLLELQIRHEEQRSEEAGKEASQIKKRAKEIDSKGWDWDAEIKGLEKKLQAAQQALEGQDALLRSAEEAVAKSAEESKSIESKLKELRSKRDQAVQEALQRERARHEITKEISQMEGRIEALNQEEARRAPQLEGFQKELERIYRELEAAEARFSEMEDAVAIQAKARDAAMDALKACEGKFREAEGVLNAEEMRLARLSDELKLAHSPAAFNKALKWMTDKGMNTSLLFDSLKIDEESRPSLERLLGTWTSAASWESGWEELSQIPGQAIVSLDARKHKGADPPTKALGKAQPLMDSIQWQQGAPKILFGLLSKAFICKNDDFFELAAAHPELALVSPSFVKLPHGPIQVGVEPPSASPLKIKADLEKSRKKREGLLDAFEALEAEKKKLGNASFEADARLKEMEGDLRTARQALDESKGKQSIILREIKAIEDAQKRADEQWESFDREKSKLVKRLQEIDKDGTDGVAEALNAQIVETENKLAIAQSKIDKLKDQQLEAGQKRAVAWSARESAQQNLEHARRAAQDSEAEKVRLESDLKAAEEKQMNAANRLAAINAEVTGILDEREAVAELLKGAQPKIDEADENLKENLRTDRELKDALENAKQMHSESRIIEAEVRGRRDTMAKEVELALGLSIPDFINSITTDEKEAWEQGQLVHQTAHSELESRRLQLGSVNPLAIQELEEVESELGILNGQRADVIESIANLEATILECNATSEERFREAFDFINLKFQEVFRRVFGGGAAHLSLQDPRDILECGIEITAQPPGKTAKALSLLSGGEKALTAISLLFAIFHFKPCPLCVLDEVDAPLDEANVARFASLVKNLKEQTQFIVITHQKPTMIAADTLYGVTMEEKGVSRLVSVQLKEAEKLTM